MKDNEIVTSLTMGSEAYKSSLSLEDDVKEIQINGPEVVYVIPMIHTFFEEDHTKSGLIFYKREAKGLALSNLTKSVSFFQKKYGELLESKTFLASQKDTILKITGEVRDRLTEERDKYKRQIVLWRIAFGIFFVFHLIICYFITKL